MAAAVQGLLQRSRLKSNRNRSSLLHVKMFSAAWLDSTSKQEASLWQFNKEFAFFRLNVDIWNINSNTWTNVGLVQKKKTNQSSFSLYSL